jgi:predicted O-methyltransferase YrrM
MQELWAQVDDYLGDLLVPADHDLSRALDANRESGLPSIDVPPLLGKLLELLVRIGGARRVLEIGTLGGYSTIWLARALPHDGRVVTLELEPRHAEIARENLSAAGVLHRVDIRVGPASETLHAMVKNAEPPFDFIFIDADKKSLPEYLDLSMHLARTGTVIVVDNVVRDGKIVDRETTDPQVRGVARCLELMAAHPRLSATAIQTVGARGYDGFAVAVVQP